MKQDSKHKTTKKKWKEANTYKDSYFERHSILHQILHPMYFLPTKQVSQGGECPFVKKKKEEISSYKDRLDRSASRDGGDADLFKGVSMKIPTY